MLIIGFDPATVNMGYCVLDIDTLKIQDWGLFAIKANTVEKECENLFAQLERIKFLNKILILYETQPRCNPKTITICDHLRMYYTMKKLRNEVDVTKIVGQHAKHKLTYYEGPVPELNVKEGYYRNKLLAIEHCRKVLKQLGEDQRWIDFFELSKKKSDLADCYLMILSYLKINKLGAFRA
jgi:hypothetical protein